MDTIEVSDPSDWLSTQLPSFAPLETALRCQVCKDFYRTPVITSCNHTFCSLCIRRCLSADGKCPICRVPEQASKMRRNLVVEELVSVFQSSRPIAIKLAAPAPEPALPSVHEDDSAALKPRKRRKLSDDESHEPSGRQTRSHSRRQQLSQSTSTPDESAEDINPVVDSQADPPNDGLVACPICSTRMKEDFVYGHLNTCTGIKQPDPSPELSHASKPIPSTSRAPVHLSAPKQHDGRSRLPEIQFDLLKDSALRKRLHDQGIPEWGSRELLKRRHTEWTNLWNAECDSDSPRSKRDLLRELDTWERTLGGLAKQSNTHAAFEKTSRDNRKDFDHKAYAAAHKSDFDSLIEQARRKVKKKDQTVPTDTKPEKTFDSAELGSVVDTATAPDYEYINTADPTGKMIGLSEHVNGRTEIVDLTGNPPSATAMCPAEQIPAVPQHNKPHSTTVIAPPAGATPGILNGNDSRVEMRTGPLTDHNVQGNSQDLTAGHHVGHV